MQTFWRRLKGFLAGRDRLSAELAEEMEAHMALEAEDRGETLEAARRRFGNPARVREEARAAWGFPALESILQDLRYGLRAMRRAPALTAVVVATLALGIGVNTAIFSVLNTVVLRPLPYPGSDRLVWLGEDTGRATGISVTWGNYEAWRKAAHSWEALAGFRFEGHTLTGWSDARPVRGMAVTDEYFGLLGMRPLLGRFYAAAEDRPGQPPLVVLNHRFWSQELGGDPSIVGKNVRFDGALYEVVGVAAPVWTAGRVDFYVPLGAKEGAAVGRTGHGSMRVLGRLKPGKTLAAARADLDSIMQRLSAEEPGPEDGHTASLEFYAETTYGGVRGTLLMLMGAALLVLLIACANVASLLLARNSARAGELAVRTAIGAGRGRLLRQLLTENLALAAAGGLAGLLLSGWCLRVLVAVAPAGIPRLEDVRLDGQALAFAALVTLATGLLAGLAPVWSAGKVDLTVALKDTTRSSGGRRRQRTRSALVVAEVALTLVLAFGAGLLVRSLAAAQSRDPGYDPRHVLALNLSLPDGRYGNDTARLNFYDELMGRLSGLPGVESVSAVHCPPGAGDCGDWFYSVVGRPAPSRNEVPIALFNSATPGYFAALRVPVRQGRAFAARDLVAGQRTALVNETLARQWWPGGRAVGQRIKVGGPYMKGDEIEIVGVVGDLGQNGLDSEAMPEIFLPYTRQGDGAFSVMVRTAGDAGTLAGAARSIVRQMDAELPVQHVAPLERTLDEALGRRRFITALLGLFAGLALALAAVGLYGLLNYWVSVREPEIAIRLALGATPAGILGWTSGHALRLTLAGLVLGAAVGWASARVLNDLLFGVRAQSATTLVLAGVAVALAAAAATLIPAWRASRVDAARRLHCA